MEHNVSKYLGMALLPPRDDVNHSVVLNVSRRKQKVVVMKNQITYKGQFPWLLKSIILN
jgi:hypothetical protein